MKEKTTEALEAFLAGLALFGLILVAFEQAEASGKEEVDVEKIATAEATAGSAAFAKSNADATSSADSHAEGGAGGAGGQGGAATAANEGITTEVATENNSAVTVEGDQVENNSSNVVLVPNNNTESCVRVFGLAFGRNGESGALGVPWRSKACDYEQAADDAFAAGERELGWFWKCQNKNLYKIFIRDGIDADEAKNICHQKAVGEIGNLRTIKNLQRRLDASEEYAEFLKSHKDVCDESLTRCKKEAYGNK